MKAILIIDHGSVRAEANAMLLCMANLLQHLAGEEIVVEAAHMELAEPDIPTGFRRCVERGATEVIAFPYMLSPGRHSTSDIPRLVAGAAEAFPQVRHRVTDAFGVHERLAELILERAGLEPAARPAVEGVPCRCWDADQSGTACGAACRGREAVAAA